MSSISRADVDLSTYMIVEKMGKLVEQQETIIKLLEEIAPKKEDNVNIEVTTSREGEDDNELPEETRRTRLKLYRAALNGDWEVAKDIFDVQKCDIGESISRVGDTALHIATAAMRIDFVKELLKRMKENDLERENNNGSTALFLAASSGNVELAKEIMKINKKIATKANKHGTSPIYMAAALGCGDMVKYLYEETKCSLNKKDCEELFIASIETDLYDFALQLLKDCPYVATARARPRTPAEDSKTEVTALHVMARKHLKFSNLANQNQRGIFKSCFNPENKQQLQARQLVKDIWEKVILLSHSTISELIAKPEKLIFEAAKRGNAEFLSILIREYPDLIFKFDNEENNYNIFHIAVKNRQEEVFKLIYEIGSVRDSLFITIDKEKNNILHLAGMSAPKDRLNIVSGSALQMQRELLWFKEVKEFVLPSYVRARNKDGFTPGALFSKEHRELKENGEKWMKETSSSFIVVAALIATVAFAAAFTIPGGNNEDTGFPIFLEKVSLKIFAISDAISLVSSSASIINFLSILTPRYTEEDFLRLLPRKLRVGLLTLFVSIASMMVMFSTTFFIFFNDRRLWIAILVAVIASTPVLMFIWQYFQLLYVVLRSTYVSDTLFHQGKGDLFRKEGETTDQHPKSNILDAHFKIQCSCSTNVV